MYLFGANKHHLAKSRSLAGPLLSITLHVTLPVNQGDPADNDEPWKDKGRGSKPAYLQPLALPILCSRVFEPQRALGLVIVFAFVKLTDICYTPSTH